MSQENNDSVFMSSFGDIQKALVEPVLLEFANKIGKRIKVQNLGCSYNPVYEGSEYDLCIYVHGIFRGLSVHVGHIEIVYGFNLEFDQREIVEFGDLSEVENDIILDTDGRVVAVIVNNTLYILLNLASQDFLLSKKNHSSKIWQALLDDYALYLIDKPRFDEEMQRRRSLQVKKQFDSICSRVSENDSRESNKKCSEEIGRLKNEIFEMVRERGQLVRNMTVEVDREQLLDRYQRLCKLSEKGEIFMSYGSVCIPVGQIDIEYEGRIYNIGKFDIIIDIHSRVVMCINTTRIVNGCYHPHVTKEGYCCLGNISGAIDQLLGDKEIETVVLLMIEFLRSYYYRGAPYSIIDFWPNKPIKNEEVVE